MKTKPARFLLFTLMVCPVGLWAQNTDGGAAPSDIIVVENAALLDAANESAQPAMVVEIPNAVIEGAQVDAPIPELSAPQLSETQVVLELPGQDGAMGGSLSGGSGNTLSVDFVDEDIRTILRNVADLSELNLVIPDALQGRTSLKLRNISWQQLFEVVLEPLGFTYIMDRGIIRIKSVDDIATEPVDTRLFVIKNAVASEISGSVGSLVDAAAGGSIIVDTRSNALLITERPSRMTKIQEIIDSLDRPNHQVMIESRFVDVKKTDNFNLGFDWSYEPPNDGGTQFFSDDSRGGLGFNPGFDATPPLVGPGLRAVFSEQEFAMRLEAMQNNENIRLVSNPTVVVMNNRKAVLEVGNDFPIRQFTVNPDTGLLEAGELEYRFFGIKLEVTPSVNAESMITLDVRPEVSALGGKFTGPTNIPDQIFQTRNADTQVTIKDGFTVALGGLTEESTTKGRKQVPFFGNLPVVGKLFQNNNEEIIKNNLIIFLTARTLNPDGTTYREIIDPRMLDAVGHTESQTPGYRVPAEDLELLRKAEAAREAIELDKFKERVQNETTDNENWQKPWIDQELKRKWR